MRTKTEIAASQRLGEALQAARNQGAARAVADVVNNGPALDAARTAQWCGEPPANGYQDENGEWQKWWHPTDPVGSYPVKP